MTAQLDETGKAAAPRWSSGGLTVAVAGGLDTAAVLAALDTTATGLSRTQAAARAAVVGPNAVHSHQVRAWTVLGRQLRSALLVLLVVTATIAFVLGDHTDAIIIGAILAASIGLGFVNEYRAERAAQALHSEIRHTVAVLRDGRLTEVESWWCPVR